MPDKLRILIVEDVPADAELIEDELQNAGIVFIAERVQTKEAYIAALSTFLPDVVLSDYSLPVFDGITALQLARERAPATPFIFVTGALGEELAIDLLKQGATDYVLKNRLSRIPVAVERALREVVERKERKRAEEALRRSEGYLAEAQRLTHTGSFAFELASNRYVYVSEECARIFELDVQEGLPSREAVSRYMHPEDWDKVQEDFDKLLCEKVDMSSEFRIVLPSGATKYIQAIRHPVLNETGDVVQVVGTAIDITERKRAEEALFRSNREVRAISNCNRSLLRATDEQSLVKEICRIICEEAGYGMAWVGYAEHDEAKSVRPVACMGAGEGCLATAGITWADTEGGRSPAGKAIRSGKSCCIQDFAADPKGAPWRESASERGFRSGIALPLKDEHAKAFGCLCIYSTQPNAFTSEEIWLLEELAADLAFGIVTLRSGAARIRAEEEVTLLSFALNNVREAVFLIDDRGRFQYANEEACRVLGYSRPELLGLGVADVDPDFPAERWPDHWRDLTAHRSLSFESRHRTRDGRIFPVEISANYLEYGGRTYNLSFARDITERKRAEEALRRSEASLAEGERLSHTGSWSWSPITLQPLYWSEEMFRILAFNPQEGLPTADAFWERVHPEDRDCTYELLMKAARENLAYEHEHRIVLPDGSVKHIHAMGHPVLNENGRVAEYVGTAMDVTERKRAEEALQAAGVYNRSLIEASLDPLVTINPEGKISDVNAATEQVTGYTRDELVGTDFSDYFTEPEKARAGYQQVFDRGFVRDYDLEIRNRSGEITPVVYNASVYRDDTGNVIGVFAAARDISQQKLTEEARSRLAAIVESSDDAIISEELDGTVTSWNDGAERLYGYSAAEALGGPISIVLPPDQQDERLFLSRIREGISIERYETERVRKDGGRIYVSLTVSPIRNRHGEIIGASAISRNITERKRADTEINRLKNYLSNIIDSMPSMLVGMDNGRTVTQWNRQAEAFTGIPPGDAIGKPIAHVLPDFAAWIVAMATDMDEHRPASLEKLLIEKEGERRFYDLMLYPLFVNSSVEGTVLRIEDVTERARIQELMVQTEKMMSVGGLAAGMSHEINNPLGIITQAAQNIERRISLDLPANRKISEELGLNLEGIRAYFEKRQIPDFVASIRTASSRAAKIVANMLQFSRRADTTMQPASLAQIVDQALELAGSDYDLKKKYDFRSIDILKHYENMPQVSIVSVEIEQVILNLLKNAAQAMVANPPDRKPRITLRLRREDRYALLEVEDNGPGMAEDIRRRVFEPFFTTKEPGVGTGLGLSVSYIIVTQNHKGLMEVQSTPGRGAVFKVRLPLGEEEPE